MASRSAWILILAAIAFVASPVPAEAGLFNRNKDKRKQLVTGRRQLSEEELRAIEYDADAATGTVRKIVTEAEEAAAKAERTCDGQMALSLVEANDKRLQAETERDVAAKERDQLRAEVTALQAKLWETTNKLTEELSETTSKLNTQIGQLEQALATTGSDASKKMRKMQEEANERFDKAESEAKAKFNAAQQEAKAKFDAAQQEAKAKFEAAQEEAKAKYDALESKTTSELSSTKESFEKRIQEMTATHEKTLADLEERHSRIIQDKNEEAESAIKRLTHEKEVSDKEYDEEIKKLEQTIKQQAGDLEKESNQKIEQITKDRDEKLAQLTAQLEATKAEMSKTISDKEDEAKSNLEKAVAKEREEKEALKKKITKEKKEVESSLANTQGRLKSIMNDNVSLKNKLKEATDELKHWTSVYNARSYCNLTHISEDATVAALAATETAGKSMRQLARQTSDKALKLKDETVKASEPYVKKAQELYNLHLKQHVDAARPHYNQYVAPNVDRAATLGAQYHNDYGLPAYATAKQYIKELFNDTLRPTFHKFRLAFEEVFAEECPVALKATRKELKSLNIKLPASLETGWQSACKNPKRSVSYFFNAIGLLLLFLMRRRILRLILWAILLPFRVLWFFFPLRLLFGSKKKPLAKAPATEKKAQQAPAKADKSNGTNGVLVKKKKGKK